MAIKRIVKLLAFAGFVLLLAGFKAQNAEAAFLYFSPSEGNYYRNENFTVNVFVDSDVSINAVSGTFVFSNDSIEALSINKSGSIVNLWVRDPSFSNRNGFGNVNFEGIVLNPGFTGTKGKIFSVVFKVKSRAAAANLNFTEFTILANDGLGTNVTSSVGEAKFVFAEPPILPKKEASGAEEQLKMIKEIIGGGIAPAVKLETWQTIIPSWIWAIIKILIAIIILIIAAIIASFGIIVLVWIWNYILRREGSPKEWPGLIWQSVKKFAAKIFVFLKFTEKEIERDLEYGIDGFEKGLREAKSDVSFKKILEDYWAGLLKIIKRFFTINTK